MARFCMYCKEKIGFNAWAFEVKKAVKPKGHPNRSVVIGCCCEDCEAEGKETFYELGKSV